MTFYHVYADESRQQAHPFMLYGLLLVPRGNAEKQLREQCTQLRERRHWGSGEFKWEKVSQAKLEVYKEFADIFFAHTPAEFRCLVVEKSRVDLNAYHQGDHETAFYEFYFQAISRNLKMSNEYVIFTDGRQNRQSNRLTDMKSKTNYHWLLQGAKDNLVRSIEPRISKTEDLLQITDVLLGAIGYDIEERIESPAKVEMVRHIAERVGCEHLREHWGRDMRFNTWKFRFPMRDEGKEMREKRCGKRKAAIAPNQAKPATPPLRAGIRWRLAALSCTYSIPHYCTSLTYISLVFLLDFKKDKLCPAQKPRPDN